MLKETLMYVLPWIHCQNLFRVSDSSRPHARCGCPTSSPAVGSRRRRTSRCPWEVRDFRCSGFIREPDSSLTERGSASFLEFRGDEVDEARCGREHGTASTACDGGICITEDTVMQFTPSLKRMPRSEKKGDTSQRFRSFPLSRLPSPNRQVLYVAQTISSNALQYI